MTHFHIDHAGLSGELQQSGVELVVLENQLRGIEQMEEFMRKKNMRFTEIERERVVVLEES